MEKKEATALTPSLLKQICRVPDINISFNHVKMSSSLLEVMQKRRYYQYQCFMRGIELLQNLIHDGVGQVGDHRQLHLPGEEQWKESVCWAEVKDSQPPLIPTYSRALLMSSAALSMRALRMLARGMDTCSEMDEKGGLSLSAAEQDIGHNSRQRDTMESTTTCVRETQITHHMHVQLWHCQVQIKQWSGLLSSQLPSVCCWISKEWK